jgi:hypothetical protein
MGAVAAGEVRAINALLAGVYVGLHTADPTALNEIAGGGYARQAYAYSLTGAEPTQAANNALIQFPAATADWGTVTHFALWTASVGGSIILTGALDVAKTISLDDVFRFIVGSLKVTVN